MDNLKRKPNLAFLGLVKVNQFLKQVVHVMGRGCHWLASQKTFQKGFAIFAHTVMYSVLGAFMAMIFGALTLTVHYGGQQLVPSALRWHYMGIGALELVALIVVAVTLDKAVPPFVKWFGIRYHTAHVYVNQNR